MALSNLHISTGLTEPSLCYTAISTKIKIKCADSFYLFFTTNQAKLDMFRYNEIIHIGIGKKVAICGLNYYDPHAPPKEKTKQKNNNKKQQQKNKKTKTTKLFYKE